MSAPKITLRRAAISQYAVIDRAYEVLYNGVRIGEVARDDIDDELRHIWHAWLDAFPGTEETGWDEAVGNRCLRREDAVADLLGEFEFTARRFGVLL